MLGAIGLNRSRRGFGNQAGGRWWDGLEDGAAGTAERATAKAGRTHGDGSLGDAAVPLSSSSYIPGVDAGYAELREYMTRRKEGRQRHEGRSPPVGAMDWTPVRAWARTINEDGGCRVVLSAGILISREARRGAGA